jgi:hypothetical protein
MLITCTTKGCLKHTEARLDRNSGEVICEECGNPIKGVTLFMKKGLQSIGQVLRNKNKQAFQAFCKNCNNNRSLYINENKAYCKVCNTQVIITAAFLSGLRNYLKMQEKEE